MTCREDAPIRPVTAALALTLVAAAVGGCQRPLPEVEEDEPAMTARVQGCWGLSAGADGAAADTVRRWLREGVLPEKVQLDTVSLAEAAEGDLYGARSYVRSREQPLLLTAWRPAGPDSIRVETPGALAGIALRLDVAPGVLRGTAVSFTDAVAPGETGRTTGPVEARPATCPD